ncbi:MAG: AtpZ/AtpI family protein [Planctomycetes bacterium]|nr:AtpZ/AtpI family protein [Planctomycetota bacterium]
MEDPHRPSDRRDEARLFALGMRYAGVASQFGITLAVLAYLGNRLDESRGWSPWGVLVGIGLGMSIGIWSMLRQLKKMGGQ